MYNKINKFDEFLNEVSLSGNIGIPGEEGSGRESWLKKTTDRSNISAREFERNNQQDIRAFLSGELVNRSKQLQRGHEEELSKLAVDSFRKVFGSMFDDIDFDFKIADPREIKGSMEETETEETQLEKLEDEGIINQIHKRKILRTLQQGKGLNSKAILNLSLFKDGLIEIMGREKAAEYLPILNKISNVAQFLDWMVPVMAQKEAWRARSGFSGSCDLQFPEDEENKEDAAQKLLDSLAKGEDLVDNENMEEMVSGVGMKIVALGVDLSVLIHEAIKGIYKMPVQRSLEELYGSSAEVIVENTDTLFDELEEIKYGRQFENDFFKAIVEHPVMIEKIGQMEKNDAKDWEIASFQEIVQYRFFSKIAMIGQEDAKECLNLINAILSGSGEAQEMCESLLREVLKDISAEHEYQQYTRSQSSRTSVPQLPTEPIGEPKLSKEEIQAKIQAAVDAEEYEEAARLSQLLGEGYRFPRLNFSSLLFERRR